jgi:hypothetical protein
MIRACLHCEGRGTVREYLNRAGDFNVHHCPECKGTGKEQDAIADAACVAAVKRIALGGITITEAMRIADAALLQQVKEER